MVYFRVKDNNEGNVASYIPQLAKYSNQHWAVSICTVDGQRLSLGDVNTAFTLQSVSKAFTYGFCLQHLGHEHVHKFIGKNFTNTGIQYLHFTEGKEPSGSNFNAISLDRNSKKVGFYDKFKK